ncbi:MAG: NADH-quinone oxidoreductase subunit M [Methylococcales bacterium]
MTETHFPLLSVILVLPLIGAVTVGFVCNDRQAKRVALLFASVELLLTLMVVGLFNAEQGDQFQLQEQYVWIPRMHIEYLVGVDGIAVLFLPLSALLTLLSIGASWNSIKHLSRFYFALLLALESVTLGIFCALDMVLFFLFWELTLPPLFFLISLWGVGAQRRNAAMKYTLFMLFGGVPLLFAIIILALNHAASMGAEIPQGLVFNMPMLLKTPLPENLQALVFLLLLLGFGVKAPLFPFHTWLPTAAMEGPVPVTALLTGLKLGVFGIIRFTLPLAPLATVKYNWALTILGAVTLLYGALIALRQTNLRRLLAFASISHVGLVIMGIASLTIQGLQGALLQLFNFSVIAGSLMLIAGFIQHRLGSNEAIQLGGLAKVVPRLTCAYFLFTLASIGIPGTSGFPAELLLFLSALLTHPALGFVALIGAIISAAYMLIFTRRTFFGPILHTPVAQTQDLRPRELALLCVPALLVLIAGLFPTGIFQTTQIAAESWLQQFQTIKQQPQDK